MESQHLAVRLIIFQFFQLVSVVILNHAVFFATSINNNVAKIFSIKLSAFCNRRRFALMRGIPFAAVVASQNYRINTVFSKSYASGFGCSNIMDAAGIANFCMDFVDCSHFVLRIPGSPQAAMFSLNMGILSNYLMR